MINQILVITIIIVVFVLYQRNERNQKSISQEEVKQSIKERIDHYEKSTEIEIKCIEKIKTSFDIVDVFIYDESRWEDFKTKDQRYSRFDEHQKIVSVFITIEWFNNDDCLNKQRFELYDYEIIYKRNMNESFIIDKENKIVYKAYGSTNNHREGDGNE